MKRTRIVALVSTLCICLALLATGVWAAVSTVNFSLNGNLKYYPEGVYVELSGQVYRGDSLDTLEPITSNSRFTLEKQTNFDNTDGEPSGNFPIKSWNIGSLPFAPQLRFIKIEVNVTNYSDFEIIGTPTIKGIDASDSDITITDPGYVYAYKGETGTYELVLELKENANEITSQGITISFDIKEAEANYDFFTYETADGTASDAINGTVISGLNTTNYTPTTAPEILIVPGVAKDGTTPLSIATGTGSSSTFNGLVSLTVILQDGLTSIGNSAFYYCRSLTSIEIPSSVTSIGNSAFYYCSSLTSIEIPSSVTSIGGQAFSSCRSLTSIEIPSSVTSIGGQAFSGCSSLTSIEIPSSVTSIGNSAFSDCSSLTSIKIPSSVTSISQYAFSGCRSLTSIEIPSSVTSIGSNVFRSCSSLTKITIKATTPPSLGSRAIPSNVTKICVPAESVETYKTASGWSTYSNIISAI